MVLVGLVLSWGCNIGDIMSVHHGFGRHLMFLGLKDPKMAMIDIEWFLKILYGFEMCYWGAVMASKFSMLVSPSRSHQAGWFKCSISIQSLLFYRRIFPTPKFRILLLAFGAVTLASLVATMVTIIFECTPIKKLWQPTIPGHCVDITKFFVASGSVNVILDT